MAVIQVRGDCWLGMKWQQLTAREMVDSSYILEVDSGLGVGLDGGLKVRVITGIIQGSAYAAA